MRRKRPRYASRVGKSARKIRWDREEDEDDDGDDDD